MDVKQRIYPSIYSANHLFFYDELKKAEHEGFEHLHVDIQDGVFVPNISFGMKVVEGLRAHTTMLFQIHLMVVNPMDYLPRLAKLDKVDEIVFHPSSVLYPGMLINDIEAMSAKAGLALTPMESLEELQYYKDRISSLIIWTGEPDHRGGAFDMNCLQKIRRAREMFGDSIAIYVDGGINANNISLVMEAGADHFIIGRDMFQTNDISEKAIELQEAILLGLKKIKK